MILEKMEPDNLTLDLVKKHLYVDIPDDDDLIKSYILSSLMIVQDYIHEPVLQKTWRAESFELIPTNNSIILMIEETPKEVRIFSNGQSVLLNKNYYQYTPDENHIIIPIPDGFVVDDVIIITGMYNSEPQITQARLLMIGTFYSYRENTVALNLSELPDGTKRILDNLTGASI